MQSENTAAIDKITICDAKCEIRKCKIIQESPFLFTWTKSFMAQTYKMCCELQLFKRFCDVWSLHFKVHSSDFKMKCKNSYLLA